MGFFGGSKKKISAQGALILAMMTVILIDGNADEDEMMVLQRVMDNSDADETDEELDELYESHNLKDRIELIANSLDSTQRMTVLANLLDVAMADGILGEREKDLIVTFTIEFQTDDSDLDKIIDVIFAKNRAL